MFDVNEGMSGQFPPGQGQGYGNSLWEQLSQNPMKDVFLNLLLLFTLILHGPLIYSKKISSKTFSTTLDILEKMVLKFSVHLIYSKKKTRSKIFGTISYILKKNGSKTFGVTQYIYSQKWLQKLTLHRFWKKLGLKFPIHFFFKCYQLVKNSG